MDAWGGSWGTVWAGAWGYDAGSAEAMEDESLGGAISLRRRVRRVWLQPPAVAFDEAEDELALEMLGLI